MRHPEASLRQGSVRAADAELSRLTRIATVLAACFALALPVIARAQDTTAQSAIDAMKRLAFLNGNWNCTVQGGPWNGQVDHLNYSFSGDGRWLIERSDIKGAPNASAVQVIGYDPAQRKIVAHEYTMSGISTKSVQGWVGNDFTTTRDDNQWQVVLHQNTPSSFAWVIHPTGVGAQPITEACTR